MPQGVKAIGLPIPYKYIHTLNCSCSIFYYCFTVSKILNWIFAIPRHFLTIPMHSFNKLIFFDLTIELYAQKYSWNECHVLLMPTLIFENMLFAFISLTWPWPWPMLKWHPHASDTLWFLYSVSTYHFSDRFCTILTEFMAIDAKHEVSKYVPTCRWNPNFVLWPDLDPTRDLETKILGPHQKLLASIFRLLTCAFSCSYWS